MINEDQFFIGTMEDVFSNYDEKKLTQENSIIFAIMGMFRVCLYRDAMQFVKSVLNLNSSSKKVGPYWRYWLFLMETDSLAYVHKWFMYSC